MATSSKSSNSARGTPTPSLTKSNSSSKNQTSIAGFFKKRSEEPNANGTLKINGISLPINTFARKTAATVSSGGSTQSMTPAPSSDPVEEIKEEEDTCPISSKGQSGSNTLPSPITPASALNEIDGNGIPAGFYSPSRKVCLPFSTFIFRADECSVGKESYKLRSRPGLRRRRGRRGRPETSPERKGLKAEKDNCRER